MKEIKKFPIKFNRVRLITRKKNKFLLKSFYTQDRQGNLIGQEGYFVDLAAGLYRNRFERRDSARAWKFIFKHFFFAKEIFCKIGKTTGKKIFVLDIGCGKGYFRKVLENNIKENEEGKIVYFGIDLRRDVLEKAMFDNSIDTGAAGDKITSVYIWHDASEEFPLRSNSFDFVVCSQVIKYLGRDKTDYLISEVHRLLKKGGVLLLSNGLMFNEKVNLKLLMDQKRNRKEYYWTTKELLKIFRKNKFKKIKIYGGETTIKILEEKLIGDDKRLINKFSEIFPDEIVESILGFFYPKLSGVKIFLIKK